MAIVDIHAGALLWWKKIVFIAKWGSFTSNEIDLTQRYNTDL